MTELLWVNFFIISFTPSEKVVSICYRPVLPLSIHVSVKAANENVVDNKDFIFIIQVKRRVTSNPSKPFITDGSSGGNFCSDENWPTERL